MENKKYWVKINTAFVITILSAIIFSFILGWWISTGIGKDSEKNMNIAKCKSLKGEPQNDGWGNISCYKNGIIIHE